jgi:hypothetical protein
LETAFCGHAGVSDQETAVDPTRMKLMMATALMSLLLAAQAAQAASVLTQ